MCGPLPRSDSVAHTMPTATGQTSPGRRLVAGTGRFYLAGDCVLRRVSQAPNLVWRIGLRVADRAETGSRWFLGFVVVERSAAIVVGVAGRIRAQNSAISPTFRTAALADRASPEVSR